MQPLAYFAVRILLGWLQYVERAQRAFTSSPLILVATGTGHCWAVVFALFTAIHIRAMRVEGYHEGYITHLPVWVSWTENLAVVAMGIWLVAGFTTFAIRVLEEDDTSLPMDGKGNFFLQIAQSKKVRDGLAMAHTLSCVCLFFSIILLCVAMACMKGTGTACEVCLCFVSLSFALPHTILACGRLSAYTQKEGAAQPPQPAIEAAAQEAAALGPQLCMILALADSPSHASGWQNFVYLVSAVAFVAAVAACSHSPPKLGDTALPPEAGELFTCCALDVVAAVGLLISFPHMNTWQSWALFVLVGALFAALWFEGSRTMFVELLDPVLVVRSDSDKMLPGKERQHVRKASWVATLLCGAVALSDIVLHPAEEGLMEPPIEDIIREHSLKHYMARRAAELHKHAHLWDSNQHLLLRYRSDLAAAPGEQELLTDVAQALGVKADEVASHRFWPDHQLLLFKVSEGQDESNPAHARWAELASKPEGKLAGVLDRTFPSNLNVTLCHTAYTAVHSAFEAAAAAGSAKAPEIALPAEVAEVVGPEPNARNAYMAACTWWEEAFHEFSSSKAEGTDTNGSAATGDESSTSGKVEDGGDLA